jgi:hypothetical protein
MDVLFQKQKLLLSPDAHGHELITDVATRWNSTLAILQRLSEQIPALHASVHDEQLARLSAELKGKLYSFNEQAVVEQLIKVLTPFKTATETLSSEKVLTATFVELLYTWNKI